MQDNNFAIEPNSKSMDDSYRRANAAYRTALLCALVPFFVGISIFLLWIVTRWGWLMAAGAYTIMLGTAFFFVGIATLLYYVHVALKAPEKVSKSRVFVMSSVCGLMLLGNFPVAFGIVAAVVRIESSYRVTIRNNSSNLLENVIVYGSGTAAWIGEIRPGATVHRRVWCKDDGQLTFQCDNENVKTSMVIESVTSFSGGEVLVTMNPDNMVSIVNGHRNRNDD